MLACYLHYKLYHTTQTNQQRTHITDSKMIPVDPEKQSTTYYIKIFSSISGLAVTKAVAFRNLPRSYPNSSRNLEFNYKFPRRQHTFPTIRYWTFRNLFNGNWFISVPVTKHNLQKTTWMSYLGSKGCLL